MRESIIYEVVLQHILDNDYGDLAAYLGDCIDTNVDENEVRQVAGPVILQWEDDEFAYGSGVSYILLHDSFRCELLVSSADSRVLERISLGFGYQDPGLIIKEAQATAQKIENTRRTPEQRAERIMKRFNREFLDYRDSLLRFESRNK